MSLTATLSDCSKVSLGVSPASNDLLQQMSDLLAHLQFPVSAMPAVEQLGDELSEVQDECSEENWDGYGARPLKSDALREAAFLLSMLPNKIEPPEISPEPSGDVELEWKKGNRVFVVSLSGDSRLHYAGSFGSMEKVHGALGFHRSIPSRVSEILLRYFSKG